MHNIYFLLTKGEFEEETEINVLIQQITYDWKKNLSNILKYNLIL